MKKLTFYILLSVTLLSYSGHLNAADCDKSCTIKNSPLIDILDYVTDSKAILQNISNQIQDAEKQSYIQTQTDVVKNYNYYIFNWNSFFTRFDYHIGLPLETEIPPEIFRDYNIIQDEIKYQNKYIQNLAKSGKINAPISKVCGDIEPCNISGNAGEAATQVLANTHKLAEVYRLSLTGNKSAFDIKIDFGENIAGNIINTYNKAMIGYCSSCEGSTSDMIRESIKNISKNNKNYKKGFKEWEDAWKLLTGEKVQSYREEQAELKKELKRQGASANTKKILLGNLEKYQNSNGSFIQNNFIVNSIEGVGNSFNKNWFDFKEAVKGDLNKPETTSTTATNFTNTIIDVSASDNIAQIVASLHASSKPYAQAQDNSAAKALSKTVRMHEKLTKAIQNLSDSIENSEDLCNQQHKGDGNCSAK